MPLFYRLITDKISRLVIKYGIRSYKVSVFILYDATWVQVPRLPIYPFLMLLRFNLLSSLSIFPVNIGVDLLHYLRLCWVNVCFLLYLERWRVEEWSGEGRGWSYCRSTVLQESLCQGQNKRYSAIYIINFKNQSCSKNFRHHLNTRNQFQMRTWGEILWYENQIIISCICHILVLILGTSGITSTIFLVWHSYALKTC